MPSQSLRATLVMLELASGSDVPRPTTISKVSARGTVRQTLRDPGGDRLEFLDRLRIAAAMAADHHADLLHLNTPLHLTPPLLTKTGVRAGSQSPALLLPATDSISCSKACLPIPRPRLCCWLWPSTPGSAIRPESTVACRIRRP